MDVEFVRNYIGSVCKIEVDNGYYFKGEILTVGGDSLVLIDKNSKRIVLALKVITQIREVEK